MTNVAAKQRLCAGRRFMLGEEAFIAISPTEDGRWLCGQLSSGGRTVISLGDHAASMDFRFIDVEEDPLEADWDVEQLAARLGERVVEEALELLGHLLEARTGYQNGTAELALPREPKRMYDVLRTTQRQRWRAKARELTKLEASRARLANREPRRSFGASTLAHYWTEYSRRHDLTALIDGRKLKINDPLANCHPALRDAILDLHSEILRQATDLTLEEKRRRVAFHLSLDAETADVKIPPLKRFATYWRELTRAKAANSSAAYQRSRARGPATPYAPLPATRPGEYVLLDWTDTDTWMYDPFTFELIRPKYLVGLDAFTGSVVGTKFVIGEPDESDALALLRNIIGPKPWRPDWGEDARWRYHGIPENVVVELGNYDPTIPIAGIPLVRVATFVSDNAWVFGRSYAFRGAVESLNSNLQFCRVLNPTDKAKIERFFRSAREHFWETFPGYKGANTQTKAENPKADAYYFLDEIEEMWWRWNATYWQRRCHDGLWPADHPHLKLSPNAAYDLGLAKAGFLCVPASAEVNIRNLPQALVAIQLSGIKIRRDEYDGAALKAFRRRTSPYPQYGGKWPIRHDPDDRRWIYFFDPYEKRWHRLEWKGLLYRDLPFSDVESAYARTIIRERGGNVDDQAEVAAELNAYLARRDMARLEGRAELRAAARLAHRQRQAAKNHEEIGRYLGFESHDPVDAPVHAEEKAREFFLSDVSAIRRFQETEVDNDDDDEDGEFAPSGDADMEMT